MPDNRYNQNRLQLGWRDLQDEEPAPSLTVEVLLILFTAFLVFLGIVTVVMGAVVLLDLLR